MKTTTTKDTADLNRYEMRKFKGDKRLGKIASKARLSVELGFSPSTLDQWQRRYPKFPLAVYKTKSVAGSGYLYYFSRKEIEQFIFERARERASGRMASYAEVRRMLGNGSGTSEIKGGGN